MAIKSNKISRDFMLAVRIPSELHRLVKIDSVTSGIAIQDIVADLLAHRYCSDKSEYLIDSQSSSNVVAK